MSLERQSAKRVFTVEFNDSTYRYQDTEELGSPSFILLPTGDRANRVWIAGTLLEVSDIGTGEEYLQARVADFSGAFYLYARPNYQQTGLRQLKHLDTPTTVSVVGRTHTYEPDESTTYVSIEPETVTPLNDEKKDYWQIETAVHTQCRIRDFDPEEDYFAALSVDQYPDLSPTDYTPVVEEVLNRTPDVCTEDPTATQSQLPA